MRFCANLFAPVCKPIAMKRKIEEKATRLPMEVTDAVERWEARRKVSLKVSAAQSEPDPLEAIQFLVGKGVVPVTSSNCRTYCLPTDRTRSLLTLS